MLTPDKDLITKFSEIVGEKRMCPLTIQGLDGAMRELSR